MLIQTRHHFINIRQDSISLSNSLRLAENLLSLVYLFRLCKLDMILAHPNSVGLGKIIRESKLVKIHSHLVGTCLVQTRPQFTYVRRRVVKLH